ncbi:unnamed protein product [Sphagnum jensenii]|uniref:Uncharacterized protein n=1 Tax=Sphagnum jensenii TaxID=128206 RepID=A0ABP0WHE8_9BRYO
MQQGGLIKKETTKRLICFDKKTRDKGLALLVLWLSCQQDVGEDELEKIWKGLFYCVSHADKAAVQDDLIARLAGILESLDLEQSLIFFKVFLSTMRREWAGTDRLKLDRFYLLLRQFLARVFMVLQKHDWNEGTVGKFMDALVERTLLATDEYPAAAINLHLVDVFLDELKERQPLSAATLRLMLQPFYTTLAVAADKSLLKKIKERIFDSLLTDAQSFIQGQQDSKKIYNKNFGPHVAALPLAASLFDVASSENTLQENRKLVYEIHDDFCRLEKLVTMAGLVELAPDEKLCEEGTPEGVRRHSLRQCIKRSKDEKLAVNSSAGAETNLGRKLKARGALVGTEKQKDSPLLKNLKSAKVMKEDGVKKGHKRSIIKLPKGKELVQPVSVVEVTQMATTVREIEVIAAGSKLDQLLSRVNNSPIQEIMGRSGEVLVGREGNALMDVSVKDAVISNLQEKFAFVAVPGTPQPLSNDLSPNESSPLNSSAKKKRKRGSKGEDSDSVSDLSGSVGLSQASPKSNGVDLTPGSNSAKRKRVRFSLKNNIVWKPHNPLPPQSLRTPPAATPRGSALKKGVPPGPIRMPPARTFRGKALSTPKRRSPKQILSVSLPKPTRSPKSLLKGPRFARRVSKSPGSLS